MWYKALLTSILVHVLIIALIFSVSSKTHNFVEYVTIDFTKVAMGFGTNKDFYPTKWGKKDEKTGGTRELKKGTIGDSQGFKLHGTRDTHELTANKDEISLNPIIDRRMDNHNHPEDGGNLGSHGFGGAKMGSGLLLTGGGGGGFGGVSSGYGYGGAEINDYGYVREQIMKNIVYPEKARRMGWEGRVILSFVINEKGFINDVKILKSSGYTLLDEAAKEAVFKINQFKKGQERMMVQLPIEFRLK